MTTPDGPEGPDGTDLPDGSVSRDEGGGPGAERGSATIEFVGVAVMVLVPLMYLVLAVFDVQREVFATTQAAREAGRAFETASGWSEGVEWASTAARLAYEDHGLDPSDAILSLAGSPRACAEKAGAPLRSGQSQDLEQGTVMCVSRPVRLPGVPGFLDGGHNTVTGAYPMHFSEYAERPG